MRGNSGKAKLMKVMVLFLCISIITAFGEVQYKKENTEKEIDFGIKQIMQYMGYKNCHLIKLGHCNKVTEKQCNVTKDEVDEYVDDQMEEYIKKIPIMNRVTVEKGDYILLSYDLYYQDKLVSREKDHVICVGENKYDAEFEENIIGAQLKKEYDMEWKIPNNADLYGDCNYLLGKIVRAKVIVKEIYDLKQQKLTDDFVKQTWGYNTIADYKNEVYKKLLKEKQDTQTMDTKRKLIESIIDTSEVRLDENIVVCEAADQYEIYENQAHIQGLSFDEYIKRYLSISKKELLKKVYEDSIREISWYLIIGGIAKENNIKVNLQEMKTYITDKNEDIEQLSEEDKSYIYYTLLEEKVMNEIYQENTDQSI